MLNLDQSLRDLLARCFKLELQKEDLRPAMRSKLEQALKNINHPDTIIWIEHDREQYYVEIQLPDDTNKIYVDFTLQLTDLFDRDNPACLS